MFSATGNAEACGDNRLAAEDLRPLFNSLPPATDGTALSLAGTAAGFRGAAHLTRTQIGERRGKPGFLKGAQRSLPSWSPSVLSAAPLAGRAAATAVQPSDLDLLNPERNRPVVVTKLDLGQLPRRVFSGPRGSSGLGRGHLR